VYPLAIGAGVGSATVGLGIGVGCAGIPATSRLNSACTAFRVDVSVTITPSSRLWSSEVGEKSPVLIKQRLAVYDHGSGIHIRLANDR